MGRLLDTCLWKAGSWTIFSSILCNNDAYVNYYSIDKDEYKIFQSFIFWLVCSQYHMKIESGIYYVWLMCDML